MFERFMMLKVDNFLLKNNKNGQFKDPSKKHQNVNFTGHRVFKDERGEKIYRFYLPGNQKDVTVEFAILHKDKNGNYTVKKSIESKKIGDKGYLDINPLKEGLDDTNPNVALGYRFIINGEATTDASQKTNGKDAYNVAMPMNRALVNKPRQMLHIIPDSFNPPQITDERRIHFNKFGGNINSIIEKIPYIKDMGFKRIISTPIFGQDNVSSHGYWTTNPYQVTEGFGTMSDFKKLQLNLYKNGLGWIADGAFVNEGVEGVHIKDIMLWGKDSPYLQWFETYNIGDESINFGVLPKQDEAYKYVGTKIVNGPYHINFKPTEDGGFTEIVEKNKDYNRFEPTFIQTFDSRLASVEQMNDDKNTFQKYDNLNPQDKNQINNYKDSIQPYTFRVNPDEVISNYEKYKQIKKLHTGNDEIKFRDYLNVWSNFKLVPSNKDGGASLWVGNKDITKFRFMATDETIENSGYEANSPEMEKLKAAQYQVQDNIVQVGKFWTNETAKTLIEHTARKLGNKNTEEDFKDEILKLSGKELPIEAKKILQEGKNGSPLHNILADKYNLKSIPTPKNITDGLMSYPLDAIEFSPDITSVLGSPYIKKLAANENDIRLTRYEASQNGDAYYASLPEEFRELYKKSDKLYKTKMTEQARNILKELDKKKLSIKILDENGELTKEGKDLYGLIASDISKFLLVSALSPSLKPKADSDYLEYDKKELSEINSLYLGLYNGSNSPKDVAERLLNKLNNGLENINEKTQAQFIENLANRVKNINEQSLLVSKLIVDATESGLEWRIDAAKDVGDWESVSTGALSREECWNKIIKFWKKFNDGVRTYNPRAYTIGELTNARAFDMVSNRFKNSGEIESKFIEETGFTTQTNYSYLYMAPHELYGSNTEKITHENNLANIVKGKLMHGWGTTNDTWHNPGFLFSGPIDNILFSHVSMGNHDKPRLLHMFSLDPNKFIFDGRWQGDKAGAMADAMKKGLNTALSSNDFEKINKDYKNLILSSIDSLESGNYKYENGKNIEDRNYNDENFGARPFDININDVIKEAKLQDPDFAIYANRNENKDEIEKLKAAILKEMLKPGMVKYKAAMQLLTFLPGNPTNYAGDEFGETGYETKCKNEFQQNRNRLHWERIDAPKTNVKQDDTPKTRTQINYNYLNEFKNEIKNITTLRTKEALSPLVNGHLVELDSETLLDEYGNKINFKNGQPVQASVLYRYNDKTDVIGVFHNYGFGGTGDEESKAGPDYYGNDNVTIEKIWLGKLKHVDKDAKYMNASDPNDKNIYVVIKDDYGFSIKRADKQPIKFKNAGIILARTTNFQNKELTTVVNNSSNKNNITFMGNPQTNPIIRLANLKYKLPISY